MYDLTIKSTLELEELINAVEDSIINNQEYIDKCLKLKTSCEVFKRKDKRLKTLKNDLEKSKNRKI